MKSLRPALFALLTLLAVLPLAAQTSAPAQPVVKTVELSRVAFVNSNLFLDEAKGIKQLVRAAQGLELEFSATQSDLSLQTEKLRTLVGELNRLRSDPVANAKAIEEKQTEGVKMQQELQAKQQQAQEAYGKRQQEVQGPVAAEIGKELRAFAQARSIGMLFDIAKLGDALLDANTELDLTAEFIAHYNASHP